MFKKIPGSTEYRIDLQCNIVDSYGVLVELKKFGGDKVTIELFGKVRYVRKQYLALLAWYEVGYINNLEQHLQSIEFSPIDSKILHVACKRQMVFKEPVLFRDGFRYIPSFPRYAINLDGDVLDTFENATVDKERIERDGYVLIYIYNPDKNGFRYTSIHRLMALAWLPNNDFLTRPYINHIDGNRANYRLNNLEWCSLSENARHALETGLTQTSTKMKSRDVISGEVVVYSSASEMSRKLGMTSVSASAYRHKLPGYLFKNRYEIKILEDDSPWYYENRDDIPDTDAPNKAIYTIVVLNKETGEQKKFINLKIFCKAYGLWTKNSNIDESVLAFKEKFPGFEISYSRNAVKGPYRVIDLLSNKTLIFDSMVEAALHIGKTRTEIQYDLSRGLKFIYDKRWIIVPGLENFTKHDYKEKLKYFSSVVITKDLDQSETVARSMKHAARMSGLDYKSIVKYINTGTSIKGMKFRALE